MKTNFSGAGNLLSAISFAPLCPAAAIRARDQPNILLLPQNSNLTGFQNPLGFLFTEVKSANRTDEEKNQWLLFFNEYLNFEQYSMLQNFLKDSTAIRIKYTENLYFC
ncbi:hypothetical protein IW15_01135 [Chryseobacterium soli]|uniref:Uncharacterized protein n=1 Tax=Chryseobacterium soli TaxID=445961 RepID=A0A086ABM1_9FLAO|nr:hypothetical protein [Chryseobacterium soli]KFF14085.1 hypothetical protein IW15_01135 [Chryseobacterium soli]